MTRNQPGTGATERAQPTKTPSFNVSIAICANKQSVDRPLQFREHHMRLTSTLLALVVPTMSAMAADNTTTRIIAEHDGSRFYTELSVQECTLTEEQWEKQKDGSRILWHYAELDLVGAQLTHPMDAMSDDIKAQLAEAGNPIPDSKVFDGRDSDNPYASFTISARDGWSGPQEYWHERKTAQKKIEKGKAIWSDRNGGDTHVVISLGHILVLFHGEDTYSKTEEVALRIKSYIEENCEFLG
ncbi:hypothetical protein [Ruegeria arenilitoris]|uniref:hypothetical protein n=1 Tax=Ruegeria arenilitoris TaxID=1173585 RepID=UPI00147A072A|nr:hypothetical protein [Ruegeria arenilitoris]